MDVRRGDRGSSVFFLALALIVCWAAWRLSIGTLEQPGSGFFPFLGGGALAVLSGANLIQALRKDRASVPATKPAVWSINWKNLLIALAVLAAFPFLLGILGFGPATFVFFVLLLSLIEPRRWIVTFGFSLAAALSFHLLFQVWIKMKFPIGIFGI